jgi:hypothetical protein
MSGSSEVAFRTQRSGGRAIHCPVVERNSSPTAAMHQR